MTTEALGRARVGALLRRPVEREEVAALAAAAFLLSSASLIYLSLMVSGYIRPGWSTAFALSGVPCLVVPAVLLVRRGLSAPGMAAVVLYGHGAIVLSAYASSDRVGTTAGALLSLPVLFTATFLPRRWLPVQGLLAAGCAWVVVALVPAPPLVLLIRTSVLVVACMCPAVIVALLRAHLDRAVLTDPLTGLLNRRGLVAAVPDLLARARRTRSPLALLMVDIDHFKQVNDQLGHVVGDEVLQLVADTVRAVSSGSLVVRLGGEELAVVVVGSTDEVRRLAETVRTRVEQDAARWQVTVSVGWSWTWPGAGGDDPLPRLLSEADARMYEAKRSGRNRVVAPAEDA
ncbi:diguanylate cyclase [Jannaschia sp. R86511]|uniref:GGDEF domain-containing protein n=1 Tax=Jannaschia sp. R86511 TaxID=3093853 RepID=UPI0036D3BB68